MKLSQKGLDLIKEHESYRGNAYDDLNPYKHLQKGDYVEGTLTIGYGHTHNVKIGDTMTPEEAEEALREDVAFAELAVKSTVKVKLTQNMFDALVSLVFNIGVANFADKQYGSNPYKGSTLLYQLNKENYDAAADRFGDFIRSGGRVLDGLKKRREKERKLFLEAQYVQTYHLPQSETSITDGITGDDVHITNKNGSSPWFWLILSLIISKMIG